MSSLNVSIEQAKRSTQDKSCFAALVAKFLPVQLHGNRFTTLGARDFSSAVSGFGTAEDVSAFGLRPTPKIPAAGGKNLWYSGYRFTVLEDFNCTVL